MAILDKIITSLSVFSFLTQFVFWFILLIVALTSQYLLNAAFVPQACFGSDQCYVEVGGEQHPASCCVTYDASSILGQMTTIRFYNWLMFCFITVTFFTMPLGRIVTRSFTVFVGSIICILYIPYFTQVRDSRLGATCVSQGCVSFSDSLGSTSGLPVLVISPLLITWCFAVFEIYTWYRGRGEDKSGSSSPSVTTHTSIAPSTTAFSHVDSAQPTATTSYGDRPSVSPTRSSNAINPYA